MTTKDVFVWDLLDRSPFLHSYLNEIEETGNTEQTVAELLLFFSELEVLMDGIVRPFQSSAKEMGISNKMSKEAI